MRGIAFDGGEGIREVLLSLNNGKSWFGAELGQDHGKYSFRSWSFGFLPRNFLPTETAQWKVRAVNHIGQSQPLEPLWNPAGYMRNVVETVKVDIA